MKNKFLSVMASVLLATALLAGAAYALTGVDQTRIMNKRFDPDGYHPSYYRVTVNYNDPNIANGLAFGALGQNEFIKAIDCHVTTAFNAVTTNVVTFGTTAANANEIVAGGLIAPGTAGVYHLTTAAGLGVAATAAGPVALYAKYTQTGAAATAGQVVCVIEFVPNNDM